MAAIPRIAVVPGSFDPPTLGHLDLIERAAALFDEVIVALLKNTAKDSLFSIEERAGMLRESLKDLSTTRVETFDGLLVDFARSRRACAIVRGIRGATDCDYELQMSAMNRHLDPSLDTVLLAPSVHVAHISSTLVREIARMGGPLTGLVPPAVGATLLARSDARRTRSV